jgi:hypothetical protein
MVFVREDGSMVPHPERNELETNGLETDNQETLGDLSAVGHDAPASGDQLDLGASTGPSWPTARGRYGPLTEPNQPPPGYVSMTWFSASVGANVALLIGLIGLIFLSYAGVFPPNLAQNTPTGAGNVKQQAATATATATATPTATPTIAPTATPIGGWLTIAPASVTLGCAATGQNVLWVILTNTGPAPLGWQVVNSVPDALVGVAANPNQGQLNPGQDTPIQIQNVAQTGGPQNTQGIIQFAPASGDAGPAATLNYSETGC